MPRDSHGKPIVPAKVEEVCGVPEAQVLKVVEMKAKRGGGAINGWLSMTPPG